MRRLVFGCCLGLLTVARAPGAATPAQSFPMPAGVGAPFDAAMRDLAARALAVYHDPDRRTDLDSRFRLDIVAGRLAEAAAALSELRSYDDRTLPRASTNYSQYVIFVRAKRLQSSGLGFDTAFAQAFRDTVDPLDDERAAYVNHRFKVLGSLQARLDADLARQRGAASIALPDVLTLVRDYQNASMYRAVAATVPALVARDDARRYAIECNVLIATPGETHSCAFVVRRRNAPARQPALLEYSIYADRRVVYDDALLSAAYGYAGIAAYTPGTACSHDRIVPYISEGANADAVIAWIARQSWSDGRVGMYGGSYNSFAQWAAAKRHPRALRALMPSVANAPGIDTPMEGNVFESWVFPWPPYVTAGRWLDAASEGDPQQLIDLERTWYVSGKPYRMMDRLGGKPNPIWDSWLGHPDYDAFWQRLVPFRSEFANIGVPALFTDGYLSGQNVGGLYYFAQYRCYSPRTETYLVLGPYDHIAGQYGTVSSFGPDVDAIDGVPIDPAAHIDIVALRYQWFDYIFKGRPKPPILQDVVNYEVMHGNRWEHAASITAMHTQTLRVYQKTDQMVTVDFKDRSDVNRTPPPSGIDGYLGFTFESAPLARTTELNGVFSGRLDFRCNKRDFDLNITLFALDRRGVYEEITNYMARASYVNDRSRRQLLSPGTITRLPFTSSRITSWRLAAGTRVIVLIAIVKDPGYQINYGTGGDVSAESAADAGTPLEIRWLAGTHIDLPLKPVY